MLGHSDPISPVSISVIISEVMSGVISGTESYYKFIREKEYLNFDVRCFAEFKKLKTVIFTVLLST